MVNAITGCRIALSAILLFVPALSPGFFAVYLLAGLSDMIDGMAARKTKTASESGAKFDTIADICFFMAAAYKILPVVHLPFWLWAWAAVIAAVKVTTLIFASAFNREFAQSHTLENKAAGLLLFLFPLSFSFVSPAYGAVPVCIMATVAAVRENRILWRESHDYQRN